MNGPTRSQLETWDRERLWHPFTQMADYEPLLIERAEGCWLEDVDGRRYLDAVSSLWCNVHGHRHPRIDAAIRAQLDKVAHTTSLGASNSTTIQLAARLADLAPDGLHRVFFSDDGATAVEVALKMAFQYWRQCPQPEPERTLFVALGQAYHGDTLGDVSVGGVPLFHAMFRPLLFDVLRVACPDTYRLPDGVTAETALDHYLGELERVLEEHRGRIAAMVIEPLVQGAAGMVMHPPGYLRGVRELTAKHNVLLIADEVAVGFGRTGTMFACQQEQVVPDLLCLAKGLSGGYLPIAATLATDRIWETFLGDFAERRSFFHGHTFAGNPLSAAAALASLDVFEEERTLEQLPAKIEQLGRHLQRIAHHPQVGDVRQRGLIGAVELVADKSTRQPYAWEDRWGHRVCQAARRHQVLMRPLGNVLVLMPPLAVSLEELDLLAGAVADAIVEVTEQPVPQPAPQAS